MLACYLKNLALFGTRKCLEGSLTFRGFASLSKDVATGVNILKGGTDPPLKPDEEYPDWLWELAEPQPTLFELRRKYEAAGKDISNMEINEVSRLVKLENRASVKAKNAKKSTSKL